jgi:hypothetical protein
MDAMIVTQVIEGKRGLDELSTAERLAFSRLVVRASVKRAPERPPTRFVLPKAYENMVRGRSI